MTSAISLKTLSSLILSFTVLLIFSVFNRYLMQDYSIIFLMLILFFTLLFTKSYQSIPRKFIKSRLALYLLIFFSYSIFSMLFTVNEDYLFNQIFLQENLTFSFNPLTNILFQFCVLIFSLIIFYNKPSFPFWLKTLITLYIVLFVLRNTINFEELKSGYRLGPGYMIFSLIGFMFLDYSKSVYRYIPYILTIFFIAWLYLLGNRGPTLSCIIFLFFIQLWPLISRNKVLFRSTYWSIVLSIVIFIIGYIYVILANPDLANTINSFGESITSRGIFSRFFVWGNVILYIIDYPVFGYGIDTSSSYFYPKGYNDSLLRDSISSHSLFLELLFRLGAVGFTLFLAIFYEIWKTFGLLGITEILE